MIVHCIRGALFVFEAAHMGREERGRSGQRLQRIGATGASVSSLTEFARALVVNKNDAFAGTELSVELPSYRLAASCQNFRFQLYLSARTIRPPSSRVKFRLTQWKACLGSIILSPLDGNWRMPPHKAGAIRAVVPVRPWALEHGYGIPSQFTRSIRQSGPRSATAGSPSPTGHP